MKLKVLINLFMAIVLVSGWLLVQPARIGRAASGGEALAWGQNTYGQLGNGTTTSGGTALQVSGLTGVTAIAAGQYHSLALTSDGMVWACPL